MSNHKVTLEVTTDQAAALTRMLDLAVRIHLAQFKEIEHLARMDELKDRTGNHLNNEDIETLETILVAMSSIFGFSSNASHGIGSKHISMDARRGWEIKKVLQKALAEHNEPKPKWYGVDYDGLICRYTKDPAPVAVVTEEK